MQAHQLLFTLLVFGCGGYAVVFGAAPERIGIAAAIVAAALTPFAASYSLAAPFDPASAIVDAGLLVAFLALAILSNRWWPTWVSALLLVEMLAHLAVWLGSGIILWAYRNTIAAPSYFVLPMIATGAAAHRQRLKRYGADSSWKRSFFQ